MAVIGYNITLAQTINGEDFVFACARQCRLTHTTELKEVTNYDSNFYREFRPDVNTWQVSLEGVLDYKVTQQDYKDVLDIARNRETIQIKFIVDNGSQGLLIYGGSAIIVNVDIGGGVKEIATYSMTLQGTSLLNIESGFVPGVTTATVGVYVASGGELTFTPTYTPAFVAPKTAYYVSRGGTQVEQIFNDGSIPDNNDVSFNQTNGEIRVSAVAPALAGEFFRIICQ